jgi:DNA-binding MarR family transcriptional regulator
VSELRALAHLGTTHGASCRLRELADPAGVSPSGLSRLVARLEHRGLVERAESPEDRRGRLACLTPLGRTCLEQAQSTEAAVLAGALADARITG